MTEDKCKLNEILSGRNGISFCTEDSAGIAFAMTPEDYTAFYSAASMNGYMISDLLVILMRDYVEKHRGMTPEDISGSDDAEECCDEVHDLFRMYGELADQVDDIDEQVRFIRRVLSSGRWS